jgi:hypothetical protein
MAEPFSIVAGVGGLLKSLGSVYLYVRGMSTASDQSQHIADQLQATKALLKALKLSFQTIRRPRPFVEMWEPSVRLIVKNIDGTIKEFDQKLRLTEQSTPGALRLNAWGRAMWPLDREDMLVLQQHLQMHLQMLSAVQHSFMM